MFKHFIIHNVILFIYIYKVPSYNFFISLTYHLQLIISLIPYNLIIFIFYFFSYLIITLFYSLIYNYYYLLIDYLY